MDLKINKGKLIAAFQKWNSFVDTPNTKETKVFYYILVSFIILGFVFFFSSKLWLGYSQHILSTPLDSDVVFNNYHSMTLKNGIMISKAKSWRLS